jgi:hypothetical protein
MDLCLLAMTDPCEHCTAHIAISRGVSTNLKPGALPGPPLGMRWDGLSSRLATGSAGAVVSRRPPYQLVSPTAWSTSELLYQAQTLTW